MNRAQLCARDRTPAWQKHRRALQALGVDIWHPRIGLSLAGATINTWTGQLNAFALPHGANNAPGYVKDGVLFHGQPVVQTGITAASALRSSGGAALVSSGTRPWLYVAGRFRAIAASPGHLLSMSLAATATDFDVSFVGASFIGLVGGVTVTGPAADTARHSFQLWLDGANANMMIDNTTLYQTAAAGSLVHSPNCVGLGLFSGFDGSQRTDASVAFIAVASTKPADNVIATIEAWNNADL